MRAAYISPTTDMKGIKMKKTVKALALIILLCVAILSVTSCQNSYVTRKESELTYSLPRYMTERNYQNIQVAYSNGEATFVLMIWGREEIADSWDLSDEFGLVEMTERFIEFNEYEVDYLYDEQRNVTTLSTYATEYVGSDELDYFFNLLALTENYAYIVTIHCDEALAEEYAPLFEEWQSKISVK